MQPFSWLDDDAVLSIVKALDEDDVFACSPALSNTPPQEVEQDVGVPREDVPGLGDVEVGTTRRSFPDKEWIELLRLTGLCTITEAASAASEILAYAVLGNLVSVDALAAAAIADVWMSLSSMFSYSLPDVLSTLCSQAHGAGSGALVGVWLQIAIVAFTLSMVLISVVWWFFTDDALRLLGVSEQLLPLAVEYTRWSVPSMWASGMIYCVQQYYEAIGVVMPATVSAIVFVPVDIGTQLGLVTQFGLIGSALAFSVSSLLQLVTFVEYCRHRGLHADSWDGWSLANFTRRRIKLMMKLALPATASYMAAEAQWQLMTIFAAAMGASELAAWSVLGTVWGMAESITSGSGKAVCLRIGVHLGGNSPKLAQQACRRGVAVSMVGGVLVFGGLLILGGEGVSVAFAADAAMQQAIVEALPLQAFGILLMSGGTVCWWALDGQGRVALSGAIAAIGGWVLNVPLAAVAVYALGWGIRGLVGSIVVAYTVMCAFSTGFLLRSDWVAFAQTALERAEAEEDTPHSLAEE